MSPLPLRPCLRQAEPPGSELQTGLCAAESPPGNSLEGGLGCPLLGGKVPFPVPSQVPEPSALWKGGGWMLLSGRWNWPEGGSACTAPNQQVLTFAFGERATWLSIWPVVWLSDTQAATPSPVFQTCPFQRLGLRLLPRTCCPPPPELPLPPGPVLMKSPRQPCDTGTVNFPVSRMRELRLGEVSAEAHPGSGGDCSAVQVC